MRHFLRTLLILLMPASALAGAWLQPEDKGIAVMQATAFTSNQFFNADSHLDSQSRFTKFEIQPYAEYGLLPNLTIGGSFSLQHVHQSGDSNDGLADTELFARTRLWHDDTQVVSLQPLIKLPSLYRDGGVPRGGSRSSDGELSLLYGRNVEVLSNRDYLDTRLGYRVRTRGLNPQWRMDAALGMKLTDSWTITPALRGTYTQDVGTTAFSENGEQDFRLLKAEIGATYALDDKRTLLVTVADHVAGTNAGAGYSLSIGFGEAF